MKKEHVKIDVEKYNELLLTQQTLFESHKYKFYGIVNREDINEHSNIVTFKTDEGFGEAIEKKQKELQERIDYFVEKQKKMNLEYVEIQKMKAKYGRDLSIITDRIRMIENGSKTKRFSNIVKIDKTRWYDLLDLLKTIEK